MGPLCSALFSAELLLSIWIHVPHAWYHTQSMTPSKAWQNKDRPLSITLRCDEMSSGAVCSRRDALMGSDGTQQLACPQEQMAGSSPHFLVFFSIIEISYTEGSYQSLSTLHTFSLDLSLSQSWRSFLLTIFFGFYSRPFPRPNAVGVNIKTIKTTQPCAT